MSAPVRSCLDLGVCQNRPVRCLTCTNDPAPWSPNDEVTCSPFELMGYWLSIIVVAVLSVGTVAGIAGFVYVRWFV